MVGVQRVGQPDPKNQIHHNLKMRNVFCPKYSRCLDIAVKEGLKDWSCHGCKYEHQKTGVSIRDFWGSILLLARLYLPEVYNEYRKEG
ncbi:MAG: hypothetical protein SRB2_02143 [Desulfobacteraceae bacterium Eth-SRB2]|nr:MAG: hypothetical protein SRB2_02143 [Desulfobacteraceae bacterium Eth-SRB2]